LYFLRRFCWIWSLVLPKMESSPKKSMGLDQASAALVGSSEHRQKPRRM
jgi:hypothetical protein